MWVKCTKAYSTLFEKGEWYEIFAAGNTLFSISHPAGVRHFVWETQHFDTTTARLEAPGKTPNVTVSYPPPSQDEMQATIKDKLKRKLEAGMWVKIRDGVLAFEESNPYREIVSRDAQLMIRLSGLSYAPLNYMVLNTIFDLDNPLTAEEAAAATRIEHTIINSVEEAKQMYGGFPAGCASCGFPHDGLCDTRNWAKNKDGNVLQQAEKLIYGDRQKAYGSVSTNFTNIAKGWEVILGTEVSAEQVGLCMAWLKIARQVNKPNIDNLIDAAGYVGCVEKVQKGL